MNNAKIGAAVLGGYVLGRTKKAKLALSLGALMAGSRIKPGQVVKAVQDSPFLGHLTQQVRTELTGAGKAAATSVLTAKADSLADTIHQRTTALHERGHPPAEEHEEHEEHHENEADEADRSTRRDAGRGADREDEPRTERAADDEREAGHGRSERRGGEPGRGEGREKKAQHRGPDDDEGESRGSRSADAQGRSRTDSAARARRPDDG
ncbi:ABC transporter substrate-binding protein [Streptomyces sp. NPDC004629]|uniref:ABC transporter substrate-binding protein n=1 Tax=Streptomyces sp. NPDC004629 TaxID=3364705 RepID=UPI0036737A60